MSGDRAAARSLYHEGSRSPDGGAQEQRCRSSQRTFPGSTPSCRSSIASRRRRATAFAPSSSCFRTNIRLSRSLGAARQRTRSGAVQRAAGRGARRRAWTLQPARSRRCVPCVDRPGARIRNRARLLATARDGRRRSRRCAARRAACDLCREPALGVPPAGERRVTVLIEPINRRDVPGYSSRRRPTRTRSSPRWASRT